MLALRDPVLESPFDMISSFVMNETRLATFAHLCTKVRVAEKYDRLYSR